MTSFIPGKTFLAGEYSVLLGGAALGLATRPCFKVTEAHINPTVFHEDSAAGRYLKKIKQKTFSVQLEDPYSQGGFGRSTAEYLAVYSGLTKNSFLEVRNTYLELHADDAVKPSGADLAFQFFGGVCLADLQKNAFTSLVWPFADLDFYIVATGLKVSTYQHLAELDLSQIKHLPAESYHVIQAFLQKKSDVFVEALKNWTDVLQKANLTHTNSVNLKKILQEHNDILLAKPCGALGADVLLVVYEKSKKLSVKKIIQNQDLQIVADADSLCEGMVANVD